MGFAVSTTVCHRLRGGQNAEWQPVVAGCQPSGALQLGPGDQGLLSTVDGWQRAALMTCSPLEALLREEGVGSFPRRPQCPDAIRLGRRSPPVVGSGFWRRLLWPGCERSWKRKKALCLGWWYPTLAGPAGHVCSEAEGAICEEWHLWPIHVVRPDATGKCGWRDADRKTTYCYGLAFHATVTLSTRPHHLAMGSTDMTALDHLWPMPQRVSVSRSGAQRAAKRATWQEKPPHIINCRHHTRSGRMCDALNTLQSQPARGVELSSNFRPVKLFTTGAFRMWARGSRATQPGLVGLAGTGADSQRKEERGVAASPQSCGVRGVCVRV